eukprot:TRINITY_DN9312_c0_g2_i3.p1 TRINITY_DN9312_c0_g2~~TRINITY_DN9312_c0_g2_i3.p1  ORF type:complete len:518 (-),score=116.40 TRINITY_DN9312_c0_g2_i3:26-1579(-)
MRKFIIFGFIPLLFHLASCDLAIITGSLTPTGGIGMMEKKYNMYYEVEILDDYTLVDEFTLQLYFSHGGYFTDTWTALDSTVVIRSPELSSPSTNSNSVLGIDSGGTSFFTYGHALRFAKGMKIEMTINNINFLQNGEEKDTVITAGLIRKGESDIPFILVQRLMLPFHPYSFMASTTDNTELTTRFTSSLGYHSSAYITFAYPSCVNFPIASVSSACESISWMTLESGLGSQAQCELSENVLKVSNINREYPATKTQTIRFLIRLNAAHSCTGNDHTEVKVKEKIGDSVLENAVLFGFNEIPISEVKVATYEAENTPLIRDPVEETETEDNNGTEETNNTEEENGNSTEEEPGNNTEEENENNTEEETENNTEEESGNDTEEENGNDTEEENGNDTEEETGNNTEEGNDTEEENNNEGDENSTEEESNTEEGNSTEEEDNTDDSDPGNNNETEENTNGEEETDADGEEAENEVEENTGVDETKNQSQTLKKKKSGGEFGVSINVLGLLGLILVMII